MKLDIVALGKKVGFFTDTAGEKLVVTDYGGFQITEELTEFATLVLEEAANVCDDQAYSSTDPIKYMECASAIRALKEPE